MSIGKSPLVAVTESGLYCAAGDFYIDAWKPVARNIVTHGHSDHASRGSKEYLTAIDGVKVLKKRLGEEIVIRAIEYGESIEINNVRVSIHPAGHVLGSGQIRIERQGEVWCITGDYKRQPDPTCKPFELVRCNTLITECTFGLPIFRWQDAGLVANEINNWWQSNRDQGRTSVLLAYALGKAQHVLSRLDPGIGPILLHGAVDAMVQVYRETGVMLPKTIYASAEAAKAHRGTALVICPGSAIEGPWVRKFSPVSIGVASGWMQVRGFRRRRAADRGFVISDHIDWPDLLRTIDETGCEHVIATHGYTSSVVRYLREIGKSASSYSTRFTDSGDEGADEAPAENRDG